MNAHNDALMSKSRVKFTQPERRPAPVEPDRSSARRRFTTADDKITVHHFNDVGGSAIGYVARTNSTCSGVTDAALHLRGRLLGSGRGATTRSRLRDRVRTRRHQGPHVLQAAERASGARTCTAARRTRSPCAATTGVLRASTAHRRRQRDVHAQLRRQDRHRRHRSEHACSSATARQSKPPIAAICALPAHPNEGQIVHFVDASSDPNGDIVTWHWDFGDGSDEHRTVPRPHLRRRRHVHGEADGHRRDRQLRHDDGRRRRDERRADGLGRDMTVDSGEPVAVPFTLSDPGERDAEALDAHASRSTDAAMPVFPPITSPPGGASTATSACSPTATHHVHVDGDRQGRRGRRPTIVHVNGRRPTTAAPSNPTTTSRCEPAPHATSA